jgi:hypothetical protein
LKRESGNERAETRERKREKGSVGTRDEASTKSKSRSLTPQKLKLKRARGFGKTDLGLATTVEEKVLAAESKSVNG